MSSPSSVSAPLWRRPQTLLFVAALALRLLALWAASDAVLVKDENAYLERAGALLDGRGYLGSYQSWVRHEGWKIALLPQYPGAYQPPGYPTFLAAVLAISGRSVTAVKIAQCVLGALSCVLVFVLGRAWFGRRVGVVAGALFALYPNLIAFSHLLWSETLFIFLLLWLLWLLYGTTEDSDAAAPRLSAAAAAAGDASGARMPSPARAVLAGVVLAAATLTRGTTLVLAPLLVLWIPLLAARGTVGPQGRGGWLPFREWPWRSGLARGAIVLAASLAVASPWTIRNTLLHGELVLVDTNGPYNLWRGNAAGALDLHRDARAARYSWPFDSLPLHPVGNLTGRVLVERMRAATGVELPTDLEVTRYASRVAWAQIRSRPAHFARAAVTKLVDMWNPTSFLLRHFELRAYGEVAPAARLLVSAAAVGSYLAVALLAVAGFGLSFSDRRLWLVAAVVLYFSAISGVAFGLTRFRLPLMPLLMWPAAIALCRFAAAMGARRASALDGRAA